MISEKKMKFSLKIFHKILLTMLVVALIPFGSLWYISSYQSREDWNTNINLSLVRTSNALVGKVSDWVDMNLRLLRQNAALQEIASMEAAKQNPILRAIGNTYEWTYLVFTIRADGQNIGRNDNEPPKQYGDRRYFQRVVAGDPVGQEVVIGKTSGKPALILATPVYAGNNTLAGVLAMAMHLTDISKTVTEAKLGKTGFAILLNEAGKVIAHGKPGAITQNLQDFSNHPALLNKEASQRPVVYEDNGKQVVAYTQKTNQGWTLIVQQDYDEAFSPLQEAQRNALILLSVSLMLLVALAYLLSQRLADPIRRLTAIAENISRGKLDEKVVGIERSDEIGALARAIERMGVSIKMAFERLRSKAA
jgi:methyl-accepting chemotaxis protein